MIRHRYLILVVWLLGLAPVVASCSGVRALAIVDDLSQSAALVEVTSGKDETGSGAPGNYWVFKADEPFYAVKDSFEMATRDFGWVVEKPANESMASHAAYGRSPDASRCISLIDVSNSVDVTLPYRDFVEERHPGLLSDGDAQRLLLVVLGECV